MKYLILVIFLSILFISNGISQFDFNNFHLSIGGGGNDVFLSGSKQGQTSASVMEDIQGKKSWVINFATSIVSSETSSFYIGGYVSSFAYNQVVSNIRTTEGTFDVSSEVFKTDVGVPLLYVLSLGKEKVGLFLKAGIVPIRSFYSLENIKGSNEIAKLDPVFLSGNSIHTRKVNVTALLSPNLRISLFPKVSIIVGPELALKIFADESYLRRTPARDLLYGGSLGILLSINKP